MNRHDYITLFSIDSFIHSIKRLFPQNIKNRIPTNLIGLYHSVGALFVIFGVFLPPNLLYIHFFFTTYILFTYYIFHNNCFVTYLSDFLCEEKTNPLTVPIYKIKDIIYYLLGISILFSLFPRFSFYNIFIQ